jgi:hypothetical protein
MMNATTDMGPEYSEHCGGLKTPTEMIMIQFLETDLQREVSTVMKDTMGRGKSAGLAVGRCGAGILLLALALPWAAGAGAAEFEMRIDGNKRTKSDHIRYLAQECLDKQEAKLSPDVDASKLEQCLMNSELFTEVSVTAEEVLTIAVTDRWTLIPLPFVRSQEDSTNIGGFVMDSNFLGRGQLIVLGATFGSLGDTYFAMLRDPSVAFTDWTSRAMYIQDFGDIFRYEGDVKVDGYHQKERTLSLSPGYQFTPDLEGRVILGYTTRDYEDAEDFETVPEDYRFWSAGLGVEYDAADYKFYFREGHRVKAEIRHQFARSGEGDPTLSGEVEWDWQLPFPGRNVLKISCEGMAVDSDAAVDSFQLGGRKSLRGVQDKGLWVQYLAGAVVDYHLPLWEGRWGTWAAGPFASYATYKPAAGDADGGWQDTVSYGLGLFYYLKKVAFPGVGIVIGRNEDFLGNFVTFQIGFGY